MPIFTLFGLTFHWRDDKWQATYDKRNIDDRFDYSELRMITVDMSNKARLLAVAWYEIDEYNSQIITAYKPSYQQTKEYANI